MPKFTSDEAKQAWVEKCAATRLSNQRAKQAKPIEIANAFQDETTGTKTLGRPRLNGYTPKSGGILGAIEEIDSKIAALQMVRRNLIHSHELVSA